MENTPRLNLPYIMPQQAQKHVPYNEAIRKLDSLVQLAVVSSSLTEPPASPVEGETHIVGAGAVGTWSGRDGVVAQFVDGAWLFHIPHDGWVAWDQAQGAALIHESGTWSSYGRKIGNSISELANVDLAGVRTTADSGNPLAVSGPGSLFTHEGQGHRLSINKATESDTASVVFQDNWQGRAEIGLAGNDAFSLKVSPDGAQWKEAMRVDDITGVADFPNGATVGGAPLGAGKLVNISAGMDIGALATSSLTNTPITNPVTIPATAPGSSLLITMIFSGFVRNNQSGEDALAILRPAVMRSGSVVETYRNHLIGALDTQPFAGAAVNTFYLCAPASFILPSSMADGASWKPLFVGRCSGAGMTLNGFGFSWTAIEFIP